MYTFRQIVSSISCQSVVGFLNFFILWFALLDSSFCLLGCGSFHFVPCIPPFLGALICFMIGRVSSFLSSCQACNQIWLKPSFGWWPTHIPVALEFKDDL
jgi:hypothetical protein